MTYHGPAAPAPVDGRLGRCVCAASCGQGDPSAFVCCNVPSGVPLSATSPRQRDQGPRPAVVRHEAYICLHHTALTPPHPSQVERGEHEEGEEGGGDRSEGR